MLNYDSIIKLFKANPLSFNKSSSKQTTTTTPKEDNNNNKNNKNNNNNNIININQQQQQQAKEKNFNNFRSSIDQSLSLEQIQFKSTNSEEDLEEEEEEEGEDFESTSSNNSSEHQKQQKQQEEDQDNSEEEEDLYFSDIEYQQQQQQQQEQQEQEESDNQLLEFYKYKIKGMSTKSLTNYSSPNTLIPSVSKTFISQFNLSISPNENNNKYYNTQLINHNNNSNKLNILNSNNQLHNINNNNNGEFDIFSIPTEMLVHLLSFLSAKDLWRISLTCKRIWYITDVFKFWEILFEKTCPRIYFAMQFNSRWTSPTPHQAKMILCYIDSLPSEYYQNYDPNDDNGQIKKVIGVMKEHLKYPSILRETCYVLKRLSYRQRKEDEHESLIARYGGIKLILQTMRTHPYDAGVQEDACGALGNLTCDSPNNLGVYSNNNYLEVVEQGGIQLILSAMRNHLYNPGVQYNTSFVLRNLARNDISESRVAQEGGIQAIATAMRNHPNHIGIQTQGCGALRNLGCNDSNKILSAREGGIALILKAMRVFSSHPDLQLNGCGALRNLARNEENKNMISKQGGIQLVLHAMTNHQDDPDVQDEGCAALINLAYQDETNEETIAQEGGVNLILRAMKNHPYHSGVQMQGRGALKNLSCNPKNKLIIARSGGIELMNIAIQNHPTYANRFLELMRILQAALDN